VFAQGASRETRIVAYADKRAAQRLQPMNQRFLRWERRHPELDTALLRARERALVLEREVCEAAGVGPDAVRRLRWVAPAMARARSRKRARSAAPLRAWRTAPADPGPPGAVS
jgi:hypothetical protein